MPIEIVVQMREGTTPEVMEAMRTLVGLGLNDGGKGAKRQARNRRKAAKRKRKAQRRRVCIGAVPGAFWTRP